MFKNDAFLTENVYESYFSEIHGVRFTPREIDILACLISARGTSKMASLLGIAPRTVHAHMRNIMMKLECNSREHILDFAERSEKKTLLSAHYKNLLVQAEFENCLKDLPRKLLNTSYSNLSVKLCDEGLKKALLRHLKNHLERINLQTSVREHRESILIRFHEKKFTDIHSPPIIIEAGSDYFSVFFKVLSALFPDLNTESQHKAFQHKIDMIDHRVDCDPSIYHQKKQRFMRWTFSKKFIVASSCFVILFVGFSFIYQTIYILNEQQNIRADLPLPNKSSLLVRSQLLKQIDQSLKEQEGIQKVALVGIGGAGKTTLARQYAHSVEDPVVWELNAETKESLIASFFLLAYKLAKTGEEEAQIHFIDETKDSERREKYLFEFVANHLKRQKSWLLIYDNISNLSMMSYTPHASQVWGKGKVILTTQNSNILTNQYIDAIQVDGLLPDQLFDLYILLTNIDLMSLSVEKARDIKLFLSHLPPFPHDVILAAAYLEVTGTSFERYLNEINERENHFNKLENKIIKNVSDYKKTRFGIISLSVDSMLKENEAFLDLLLFIALMDSQKIPKSALVAHSKETIVNSSIAELKKHSFILNERELNKEGVFSFHRNIQPLIIAALKQKLSPQQLTRSVRRIMDSIKSFYKLNNFFEPDRSLCEKNNPFFPHLQAFVQKIPLLSLPDEVKGVYENELILILGNISYKCCKGMEKTKNYLQKVYTYYKQDKKLHFSKAVYAKMLSNLGAICTDLGAYEAGIFFCKESLKICKSIFKLEDLSIKNKKIIGVIYNATNQFDKAKAYLKEALKDAKKLGNSGKVLAAEIYEQLADLYSRKYINQPEAQKGLEYARKSLDILNVSNVLHRGDPQAQKRIPGHSSKHKKRLGDIYCRLGQYNEAEEQGYKDALHIIENKLDDHVSTQPHLLGQIELGLGEIALRRGDLITSEKKLSKAILSLERLQADTLPARIFRAEARIRLGKLDDAYEDCKFVLSTQTHKREHQLSTQLLYIVCLYHAAVIQYKVGDFVQSSFYLNDFFNKVDLFCEEFLKEPVYKQLRDRGAFSTIYCSPIPNYETMKTSLDGGCEILVAIFGINHPFVKDYLLKAVHEDNFDYRTSLIFKQVESAICDFVNTSVHIFEHLHRRFTNE